MAWIAPTDVTAIYPEDTPTPALIEHVQGLAQAHIGTQTEPVGLALRAVMVQIVHRFSLARNDDDNVKQEAIGSYSYTKASQSGLGLTNREITDLKRAAGKSQLFTQPTYRDDRLEVPLDPTRRTSAVDADLVEDAAGGDPIPWIASGDP